MNWHTRYQQQARWTQNVRNYLWKKSGLKLARQVLELGCGTGALLETLPATGSVTGLDLSRDALREAGFHAPAATLIQGEGASLPFASATFDLVFCHYLLLWVKSPATILLEMARVTRPGGAVLALAEPDYAARISAPPTLVELGKWQAEALRQQGINPRMGRQLAEDFAQAGITLIESGIHAGAWSGSSSQGADPEWDWLEADLAGKISSADLQKMKQIDHAARLNRTRVWFVPTFYAWGRV